MSTLRQRFSLQSEPGAQLQSEPGAQLSICSDSLFYFSISLSLSFSLSRPILFNRLESDSGEAKMFKVLILLLAKSFDSRFPSQ
jgi:hypothetical protein